MARFSRGARFVIGISVMMLAGGGTSAQERRPSIEIGGGWAGFVDESLIDHSVFGGAARFHLTPRVSIGPELTYMIGPGQDRDMYLLGNLYFDFVSPRTGRPVRAVPFVIAGGGLFRHRSRFSNLNGAHHSGTFAAGGGVRLSITDRVYVAPDVRLGFEDLHTRATVSVGLRFER